jgi:S1-C subfamily serine protease
MLSSTLRQNVVFVAGWVVAGLAIALLVNQLWTEERAVPAAVPAVARIAPDSTEAGQALVSDSVVTTRAENTGDSSKGHEEQAAATPAQVNAPVQSYAQAVQISAPAVVSVYTLSTVRQPGARILQTPEGPRRVPNEKDLEGLGSGVIVDAQGHIVTNHHVVDRAKEILVQIADGRRATATVVGTDEATDLAVLKIDLPRLPVMPLGREDQVKVGDIVLAIGNPLGLTQTVTHGIVSAKGRALGVATYENFIQTDAAINKGNSGGALVNARGELIGINSAVVAGAEGLGMAIPVDLVRGVMQEILGPNKRVIRGWIGLLLGDVTPEYARDNNLPHYGVLIADLHPASPAYLAGLRVLDKIETLDGKAVRTGSDMMSRIVRIKPGSSATVTGIRARNGQPFSVELTVIEAPKGSQ